jgi:8-oxo-dGTP diphosphatase
VGHQRFQVPVAVYGLLCIGEQILLMRREGSGYHDGKLSVPAGHLDGGEHVVTGLIRELHEEVGVLVDPAACHLVTVLHRAPEAPGDDEYLDLFFSVGYWAGTPSIGEPDKCSELLWATLRELPVDVIDYVASGIHASTVGQPLVTFGWENH